MGNLRKERIQQEECTNKVREKATLLRLCELQKDIASFHILKNLDFDVSSGETICLVGPNGSGKSTTLKTIAGIYKISAGYIEYGGFKTPRIPKEQVGYLPEERGLFLKESIVDQVRYFSKLKNLSTGDFEKNFSELVEKLELKEKVNRKVQELSLGNQQRVQWLVTLIHQPRLLLLDEPFNGLDPHSLRIVTSLMSDLISKGAGILVSSHQLSHVREIGDRILFIKSGEIIKNFNGSEEIDLAEEYERTFHG